MLLCDDSHTSLCARSLPERNGECAIAEQRRLSIFHNDRQGKLVLCYKCYFFVTQALFRLEYYQARRLC